AQSDLHSLPTRRSSDLPFIQLNKEDVSLEEELEEAKMFLKTLSDVFPEVVSVASNHNDFLDRWITNNDWRKNRFRKIYLELANRSEEHTSELQSRFDLV